MNMLRWILIFFVVAIADNSLAQIGVASPPMIFPQTVTCTNMELSKQVPCADSTLFFFDGQSHVQQAFNSKDFAKLDDLYSQWCKGNDRFPDGRWKLSQYGAALHSNFSAWKTWTKDFNAIKSWQTARPESAAAVYAEAVYWSAYAWDARGEGFASSVSSEGWELFRERLGKASQALTLPQIRTSDCPAPYVLIIELLTDQSAKEETYTAVFNEAVRKFPQYHSIYFAMARHYEPRWGGSLEAYEAFAVRAAKLTHSFEGDGMYARLYWLVDSRHSIPFRGENNAPPNWKKLRAGYEDLVRLYPSSIHNIGKFAGVACRSSDSALYRELRAKIENYERTVEMPESVDACDRRHKWVGPK